MLNSLIEIITSSKGMLICDENKSHLFYNFISLEIISIFIFSQNELHRDLKMKKRGLGRGLPALLPLPDDMNIKQPRKKPIKRTAERFSKILADTAIGLSNFKQDPIGSVEAANGSDFVVLSMNKPVFYCITKERYESLVSNFTKPRAD